MFAQPRVILGLSLVAAVIAFAGVQDRVTAAAARRYVALQREAIDRGDPRAVTVDDVVGPAVSRSVRVAAASAGVVAGAGCVLAGLAARRQRRR